MNSVKYYFQILSLYVSNKFLLFISTFTIGIISFLYNFLSIIVSFEGKENLDFIYWNFISPFITYISMIFFMCSVSVNEHGKNSKIRYFFLNIVYYSIGIIIIKLLWNIIKAIIVETNIFQVTENSPFYPIFLLLFFWVIIYFLVAYSIPFFISNSKDKFSFYQFFMYTKKNFWKLLLDLLFSFFFSLSLFILFSFFFSYAEKLVFFIDKKVIHEIIEGVLLVLFQVTFAHMISLLFMKNYKES